MNASGRSLHISETNHVKGESLPIHEHAAPYLSFVLRADYTEFLGRRSVATSQTRRDSIARTSRARFAHVPCASHAHVCADRRDSSNRVSPAGSRIDRAAEVSPRRISVVVAAGLVGSAAHSIPRRRRNVIFECRTRSQAWTKADSADRGLFVRP